MKRFFCLLFFLVIGMTLLSSCAGSSSKVDSAKEIDWEPTIHETVNNLDGVSMHVNKETVSSTGLTVILENPSDKQGLYGDYFMLEKKIDGAWYEVPIITSNYGFNDIGYDLPPSDIQEWTVDWDWLYGKLESGEYRIIKDVSNFRKAGDYDKYYLAVTFTIE